MRLVGIIVVAIDLLLWWKLRKRLVAAFPEKGRKIATGVGIALLVVCHPALVMAVGGWSATAYLRQHGPDGLMMLGMGAQVGVLLTWLFWGVEGLVRMVTKLAARLAPKRAPQPPPEALPVEPVDPMRRQIVTASALVLPTLAFGTSISGVAASRQKPVVTRIQLPVRRELSELHGITIAQVSDVHVGSYMDAERLDEIRDAINALGADFHVITGDLLDNHVSQLEESARFVRGLRPRRGQKFLCMGNHEYIAARSADVRTIVSELEAAGGQMLLDEARPVRVGAHHLWMSGIDYPPQRRRGRPPRGKPTSESLALALGQMKDDGAPRILLSHHPRTFVEARELPIDLMLSGHTHGGQIKLGRIGDYSLTPVLPVDFYHNGLYQHHGRRLYVNSGAGGWLPVRINCPPEITLVELVAA